MRTTYDPGLCAEPPSPHKDRKKTKKEKVCNILIPAAKPDDPDCPSDRIRIGICAMDKKARSKPMGEILSRLDENLFRVVFFGDQMILNEPVEDWPICDVLIAFYSTGKCYYHRCNRVEVCIHVVESNAFALSAVTRISAREGERVRSTQKASYSE